MQQEPLFQRFISPSNAYRGKPFWSWNGKLDREELLRQIRVIQEMGFGGHFMHSRTGLATEYLGKTWFDLINACADESEKLGLESWLYDEDRWPSGTAGGMVTSEPRFQLKFLRCRPLPGEEFTWDDGLVAAFVCDLNGMDFSNGERITAETPSEALAGRTVLAFSTEAQEKSSFYNGQTYLDTMNREGTERFIELTHEQYKAHCGDRLGTSIKGIFTDEPHRGALMSGFSVSNEDNTWLVPWTYTVFEEFKRRFGYDLVARLPELFLRLDGEPVSPVKWHYVELLQQLFIENWAKPCEDWCRENKLILTGHYLHEDCLTAQVAMCGSIMRYYEHMEYPGIDLLTENNKNFWVAKQLDSAARQVGQYWRLSELDGCTGWQMPFAGHKAIGDWQALFGINLRCPHLSWYTMEGEAKRDFPASIFHQSPWYREYALVEEYFARIAVVMSEGTPACDLLVLNPVESVAARIHPEWANVLAARDEAVVALETAYTELFHTLAGAQLDWDYGDEEMMGRLGSVAADVPALQVGKGRYKAVVVSGLSTIRSTTLGLLDAFAAAGGTVIFAGDPPKYVDALPSDRAEKLAARCVRVAGNREGLVDRCEAAVGRHVSVTDASGAFAGEIFCQVRHAGEDTYVMALNTNREEGFNGVTVRIKAEGFVEEWKAATGERYAIEAVAKNGFLEFSEDFVPGGEHLYVVRPERDSVIPTRTALTVTESIPVEGPYAYTLGEPNVLVLDFAAYQIDGGEWRAEKEVLKVDQAVRDAVELPHRGGDMLQPWFVAKKGYDVRARVALRFTFNVDVLPEGPVDLMMEAPDAFAITINGTVIPSDSAKGWWIDQCFKLLPLPDGRLVQGENVIEIATGFHEATNLEALYLVGNFGVDLDGKTRTMVARPERVGATDLVGQHLPFYSGPVSYTLKAARKPADGERIFLTVPDFEGACFKVSAPNHAPIVVGWHPYEADVTEWLKDNDELRIEVVLTRRNLFGPLHQLPRKVAGYGPGNFISDGPGWSDDYVLYPAGLLAAPVLEVREPAGSPR